MAKSVLHIKVEHEFRIFLFDEEKGIATPNEYFHLEVNKGEQDLMFVSTKIEKWKYQFPYIIKEQDCDYKIILDLGSLERLSHLYRKAQSGIKEYQYELGNVWFGLNDYDQAVYWYRQSARQGYDSAQYYLGKVLCRRQRCRTELDRSCELVYGIRETFQM